MLGLWSGYYLSVHPLAMCAITNAVEQKLQGYGYMLMNKISMSQTSMYNIFYKKLPDITAPSSSYHRSKACTPPSSRLLSLNYVLQQS